MYCSLYNNLLNMFNKQILCFKVKLYSFYDEENTFHASKNFIIIYFVVVAYCVYISGVIPAVYLVAVSCIGCRGYGTDLRPWLR